MNERSRGETRMMASKQTSQQIARSIILKQADLFHINIVPENESADKKKRKIDWWAFIIYLCLIYLVVELLALYKYDYYKFKLKNLEKYGGMIKMNDQNRVLVEEKIKEARDFIKNNLGSPFMDLPMVAESVTVWAINVGFIIYIQVILYFHFAGDPQFDFTNYILDPEKYEKKQRATILTSIHDYIDSSGRLIRYVSNRSQAEWLSRGEKNDKSDRSKLTKQLPNGVRLSSFNLAQEHERSMAFAKRITTPEQWKLFVRSDRHISNLIGFYLRFWKLFFRISNVSMVVTGLMEIIKNRIVLDELDFIWLGAIGLVFVSTNARIGYYLPLMFSNCLDQVWLLKSLSKSIQKCIETNNAHLEQVNRDDMSSNDQIFDEMNYNLTLIYLKFKNIICHLKPVNSQGFLAFSAIQLMLAILFELRLHSEFEAEDLRVTYFTGILPIIFWTDVILIPICYVYYRCLSLTKRIYNLLAHTVEIGQLSDFYQFECAISTKPIYSQHTCWLLRKETDIAQVIMENFATQLPFLGVQVTFRTLLKLHFWIGIIMISTYIAMTTGASLPLVFL